MTSKRPIKKTGRGGYGDPPLSGQFKKGVSGNPKGRPKNSERSMTIDDLFLKAARKTIIVNQYGERIKTTKLEVMVEQLVNTATGGDKKSYKIAEKHISAALEAEARKLERENSKAALDFGADIAKMLNEFAQVRKLGVLDRDKFKTLHKYADKYVGDE